MRACKHLAFLSICWLLAAGQLPAAELIRITEENFEQVVPKGKEVDAILGDWVLRNDQVVAVIAQPVPGRKANMTVRGVAGMLIDFSRRYFESDQLSCFYPAAGRYTFEDPSAYQCVVDGTEKELLTLATVQGGAITLRLGGSPLAADGTSATVTYTLADGEDSLQYTVEIANESSEAREVMIEDALRCDGNLFTASTDPTSGAFFAVDLYFGQGYGIVSDSGPIQAKGTRPYLLQPEAEAKSDVASGESLRWAGRIACSQGQPGLQSWARSLAANKPIFPMQLKLQSPQGPVEHASVEIFQNEESQGTIHSDAEGVVRAKLLPGETTVTISSSGRETREHQFVMGESVYAETLSLPAASRIQGTIVDGQRRPIAAKVQFVGLQETADPDFGPDSAIYAVKNVVYSAPGKFQQPIDPGKYRLIVSHGPEYDADMLEIEVMPGQLATFDSALQRTVDTSGWISAEFHSHSSPSGDNVSHQLGRVLNLLAEHIEFAPCTEHNRIDTYEDDLQFLDAVDAMATCTGMELTGSLLPVNHQNAFPLHRHVHEQDGGGPQTDSDPVAQIERLALWDHSAAKVVQGNHPNIPQILGDRDLDGIPDDGFRGMLGWMDVIEVHPPQGIFTPPPADIAPKDKFGNRIFGWLQLLNLGYRIPGVINTDAHYNFHGSGWHRNYLVSSTDEPSRVNIDEMIHASEHGHLIMTTGPFLQAEVRTESDAGTETFLSGDDVLLTDGRAKLWVRVQCPNWFDINRVQVFANGRPVENLNFTRKSHPQLFSDDTVRFESEVELKVETDTHVIVAAIGEGLKLGPIMGPQSGELPPVAVTNPIFLDYDGGGFQANGDDLGVPVMLPQLEEELTVSPATR